MVVARALIANSRVRLSQEDVLGLFGQPRGAYAEVAAKHSPKVFDAAQAAWVDRALAQANQRAEPKRSLLMLLIIKLVLKAKPMSLLSATDAAAANRGDFDKVSSRRLGHYLRPAACYTRARMGRGAVGHNAGVFGGSGVALQGDASPSSSRRRRTWSTSTRPTRGRRHTSANTRCWTSSWEGESPRRRSRA